MSGGKPCGCRRIDGLDVAVAAGILAVLGMVALAWIGVVS